VVRIRWSSTVTYAAGHRRLKAHPVTVEAIRDTLASFIVGGRIGRHFVENISHLNLSQNGTVLRGSLRRQQAKSRSSD
jgi:hypothetical protein